MKNRNIFYGYCYKDGNIVIHESSATIVKEICKVYLDGKSLLEISEWLNERQIEYMPGVVGWNKSRVMRILENKSYIGDEKYPAIIKEQMYKSIQSLKTAKNRQKEVDRSADIFHLYIPVKCPNCKGIMKRRVDKRRKNTSRWDCLKPACKTVIGINDEILLDEITEVLNAAITNPEIITLPIGKEIEPSLESRKLDNEIKNAFNSINLNQNAIREMMIRHVSLKYAELDSSVCRARRLKNIFSESQPLTRFSVEFLHKTTDEIMLYADGTVGIILENKQEIRKGI